MHTAVLWSDYQSTVIVMRTGIIYHSHSGITRGIAEKVQNATGGSTIEVIPKDRYSALTVVPKGCYRALKGVSDQVTPSQIDVSGYDLIVLASPVWAGRPTPVINGAVDALTGSSGKKVFIVVTCNDRKSGDSAVTSLISRCDQKGLETCGSAILDRHQVRDEGAESLLVRQIEKIGFCHE